ncbi:MAG: NUDIX hydrolase, partial [Bacteroidetes bacterium]|nr:NUDIX hydrolase [Bacteroidota bacterium]
MTLPEKFNIRVYGLLYNEKNEILLSTENIDGYEFTKFPGGGLEFGEGTRECLIREFKEECGILVKVVDHIYTTDFFQPSAFNKKDQLISIYYRVTSKDSMKIPLHKFSVPDSQYVNHTINFFWMSKSLLDKE